MNPQAAQQYLRTKVLTATPEQLQLMLFDGALRFGQQAAAALEQKQFEQSYKLITKVQNIVTQLIGTLKHDVDPDICGKLAALYTFAYKRLTVASGKRDPAALQEALEVLEFQRETWVQLMGELSRTKAAQAAASIDLPEPDERMEASISVHG
jgi:flagellar secretion chaperone FliS